MFNRKKSDAEERKPAMDSNEDLSIPGKPAAKPAATLASSKPPVMPPRPNEPARSETPRPGFEMPRRTEGATGASAGPLVPTPIRRAETEHRKLIVGREIALSGEITSCDRLVVEGSVEANLANCRDIDIAESGLFKGSASIEEAEIRGRFEGTLTVRKRLLIRSTGKVVGTIRYGQLEVECGGQISGDVQFQGGTEAAVGAPGAKIFESQVA